MSHSRFYSVFLTLLFSVQCHSLGGFWLRRLAIPVGVYCNGMNHLSILVIAVS